MVSMQIITAHSLYNHFDVVKNIKLFIYSFFKYDSICSHFYAVVRDTESVVDYTTEWVMAWITQRLVTAYGVIS
jgi:hypothetical protein